MSSSRKKSKGGLIVTRREFGCKACLACSGFAMPSRQQPEPGAKSLVVIARQSDRAGALASLMNSMGALSFKGKDIYLKGNFNSAHPFPASTHPDMLTAVLALLRGQDCRRIVLIERSGMGLTREIWEKLHIPSLAKPFDVQLLSLDELQPAEWRQEALRGSHWKRGVHVPAFLTQETCVVQVCNLKTHRFGGHFSASLKNSIGLIAKVDPTDSHHNYMSELHSSPYQRSMIAEANQVYTPSLVVMDAIQVFVAAGPEQGEREFPGLVAASRDRVAIDAAGVAVLRLNRAGYPLNKGNIFDLEQVKRAADLNLGAKKADEMDVLPANQEAQLAAIQIKSILEGLPRESR